MKNKLQTLIDFCQTSNDENVKRASTEIQKMISNCRNNVCIVDADWLEEIEQQAEIYDALMSAGVDNWDGYDDAMESLSHGEYDD